MNKKPVLYIILILFVCIGIYVFIKNYLPKAGFEDVKYTVHGIDLSHHNPIIDWEELSGHNISFVYMKATGGIQHIDRNYIHNYKSAKRSNIKAGSYHFYLFGVSGEEQAKHFLKHFKYDSGDLFPAIDVEHSRDNIYSSDTAYQRIVTEELKKLERAIYEYVGVHPVIYTNKHCYDLYIKGNFGENLFWICDLKEEPDYIKNWIIWQFSHTGELDGVEGNIDLNYYRYTYNEITKILIP